MQFVFEDFDEVCVGRMLSESNSSPLKMTSPARPQRSSSSLSSLTSLQISFCYLTFVVQFYLLTHLTSETPLILNPLETSAWNETELQELSHLKTVLEKEG